MPSPAKVALVTGSGKRRVGNVIARRLAERGYAIAVHYRHSADEAEETVAELRGLGVPARAWAADVAVEGDVRRMFAEVHAEFGRLDVLVTAASIWTPKPLEQTTAADVLREFEVNTLGTFLCCQQAGAIMAAQAEGGAIVTIGDWAVERPYPNYAAYLVAKGAIPTLTRVFAVELALRNPAVRVNCILPGPVLFDPQTPEEERRLALAGTLARRQGTPEHVAQAVLLFAENDFVTGACLPVDGGRSIASAEFLSRRAPGGNPAR